MSSFTLPVLESLVWRFFSSFQEGRLSDDE
jgi:hypothetical protein